MAVTCTQQRKVGAVREPPLRACILPAGVTLRSGLVRPVMIRFAALLMAVSYLTGMTGIIRLAEFVVVSVCRLYPPLKPEVVALIITPVSASSPAAQNFIHPVRPAGITVA